MAHLELRLMGPIEIRLAAESVSIKSANTLALLTYLTAEAGYPHRREELAAIIWPDWPPRSALNNLRGVLFNLRHQLGDHLLQRPCLLISPESIQINRDSDVWVDLWEAEHNLGPHTNLEQLQSSLAHYRGLFLEGFTLPDSAPFEEWLTVRREALKRQVVAALHRVADEYEARGQYDLALPFAYRQVEMESWMEEAHQQIMRLLAQQGRRSEALAQYEQCRRLLIAGLGVEPGDVTRQLYEDIRDGRLKSATILEQRPSEVQAEAKTREIGAFLRKKNNLPVQLTSFIGREKEINELNNLLTSDQTRLVTLTGPGGTGKTRLGLKAAEGLLETFPDGVFLVELAPLSDPMQVVGAISSALSLQESPGRTLQQMVLDYLENKHLLLILDNCEHLVEECARQADLFLKSSPGVKVLATSREILGMSGETSVRVPPLELPDVKQLPGTDALGQVEAVRLFVERGRQASPGFALSAENAPYVVLVCQRLDGIPLALEMAAARLRMMTVQQVASRLVDMFRLLTGGSRSALPRQQTLKAAMDWSYALLTELEKLALMRLSVFAGSWTLEGAEAVCAGEGIEGIEVLDLLGSLVDKSLVTLTGGENGGGGYRMLETVRQYAHDRLLESGKSAAVRDRHLAYYLKLGENFAAEVRGRKMVVWLNRMEAEQDNLRLALDWALERNLMGGLRLGAALQWLWHLHSHYKEGMGWLEKFLAEEEKVRGSQPLAAGVQPSDYLLSWVRVVTALGLLEHMVNIASDSHRHEYYGQLLKQGIALCRQVGDIANSELAWALQVLGLGHGRVSGEIREYAQECVDICRKNGYTILLAHGLYGQALYALDLFHTDQAEAYLAESLGLYRSLEDLDGIATCLFHLSFIARIRYDYARAYKMISEAIAIYRQVGNLFMVFNSCGQLLCCSIELGQNPEDFQQAQSALDYYRETGDRLALRRLLFTYADVEWARGNFTRAEEFCKDLFMISLQDDPPDYNATYYGILERIKLTQGDLAGARQFLQNSLSFVTDPDQFLCLNFLYMWVVLLSAEARYMSAARIFGAMDDGIQQIGGLAHYRERQEYAAAKAKTRLALSEEAFTQAWKEGQALTLWQALQWIKNTTNE